MFSAFSYFPVGSEDMALAKKGRRCDPQGNRSSIVATVLTFWAESGCLKLATADK